MTIDPALLIHEIGSARLDALHWRTECARRDQRIADLEARLARAEAQRDAPRIEPA